MGVVVGDEWEVGMGVRVVRDAGMEDQRSQLQPGKLLLSVKQHACSPPTLDAQLAWI